VIIYSLRGDIYTKQLSTGQVQRLTHDGLNIGPRWSPSGRWITFNKRNGKSESAATTWLMRPDGSHAQILCGSDGWEAFTWSPTRDEVATTNDDNDLIALRPETGKTRKIVSRLPNTEIHGISWSPDGKWLAYVLIHWTTRQTGDQDDFRSELWRVRAADGKEARRLYTSRGHDAVPMLAKWSADNKYVLFWELIYYPAGSVNADGVPLYAVAARGGKARLLSAWQHDYDGDVLHETDFIAPRPGTSILAVSIGGDRFRVHNKRILSVNLNTGAKHRLTSPRIAATCPVWSPDGKRIAFFGAPETNPDTDHSLQPAFQQMRVWVMDSDGSHQRCLDSGTVYDEAAPRWLPDGRSIAYERYGDDKPNSVWVIDTVTNHRRCIAPALGGMDETDGDGGDFDLWTAARR
jgi:Tol biopolymer transport system component